MCNVQIQIHDAEVQEKEKQRVCSASQLAGSIQSRQFVSDVEPVVK
jgi:hypothetical protein